MPEDITNQFQQEFGDNPLVNIDEILPSIGQGSGTGAQPSPQTPFGADQTFEMIKSNVSQMDGETKLSLISMISQL